MSQEWLIETLLAVLGGSVTLLLGAITWYLSRLQRAVDEFPVEQRRQHESLISELKAMKEASVDQAKEFHGLHRQHIVGIERLNGRMGIIETRCAIKDDCE